MLFGFQLPQYFILQIFKGHVIPNGILDSKFVRTNMQHRFTFRSMYGIPFTFAKQSTGKC